MQIPATFSGRPHQVMNSAAASLFLLEVGMDSVCAAPDPRLATLPLTMGMAPHWTALARSAGVCGKIERDHAPLISMAAFPLRKTPSQSPPYARMSLAFVLKNEARYSIDDRSPASVTSMLSLPLLLL